MINRIFNLVLFISNNELRGNVAPDEFNQALYNSMLEIYEDYFYELNRILNRLNRGLSNNDFADIPEKIREKIRHYLTIGTLTKVGDRYNFPDDLRYVDSVISPEGREVEAAANSKIFRLVKQKPSLVLGSENPIYLQTGSSIEIYPEANIGDYEVYYLRNPKVPKWTYLVVNSAEIFNPSANDFQDVDMHVSEESNLINKILIKMGINLKEQDLTNYMMRYENQQFQKENSN